MLPKKVEIQPLYDRESFIIDCHFRVYPRSTHRMLLMIKFERDKKRVSRVFEVFVGAHRKMYKVTSFFYFYIFQNSEKKTIKTPKTLIDV